MGGGSLTDSKPLAPYLARHHEVCDTERIRYCRWSSEPNLARACLLDSLSPVRYAGVPIHIKDHYVVTLHGAPMSPMTLAGVLVDERSITHSALTVRDALRHIADAELREGTLKFFEQVRAEAARPEVAVIVMAARRLTCLYLLMVRSGMPEFSVPVISDRDLIGIADVAGKTALVLDDTVVLCSTLVKLVARIRKHGGDARVRAICIDAEQIAQKAWLGVEGQASISASSVRVSRFSRDLARTLFLNESPYFSDFPITGTRMVSLTDFAAALVLEQWFVADVTASELTDGAVSAHSFVPRTELQTRFIGGIARRSPTLARFVAIAKVRLFSRREGFALRVRTVPITVLASMQPEDVDQILREVQSSSGICLPQFEAVPYRSVQRWLQALCAMDLLAVFQAQAPLPSEVDRDALCLDFGEALATLLLDVAATYPSAADPSAAAVEAVVGDALLPPRIARLSKAYRRLLASLDDSDHDGYLAEPQPGDVVLLGQDIVGPIAHIFSFIDGIDERAYRRNQRSATREAMEEADAARRLETGLDFSQIVALLTDVPNPWLNALASFALDLCNDVGVAVPVTVEDGGVVLRRFRLGENAYLAGFPFNRPGRFRAAAERIEPEDAANPSFWLVPRLRSVRRSIAPWKIGGLAASDRSALLRYGREVQSAVASELRASHR